MEIEFKVKLDTEKQRDIDMIEEVMFQLQDIKELLERKQVTKKRTRKTTQE